MPPNDGGPAFPRPASEDRSSGDQPDGNDTIPPQKGMTLRDYFAGQAIGAVVAAHVHQGVWVPGDFAVDAYAVADAMIAARSQSHDAI